MTENQDKHAQKLEELKEAARPLIKWLNENGNPHHTILVTPDSVELLSAEIFGSVPEFIKD